MMGHQVQRMLFVGDDWIGSNATSLRNAFQQTGIEVVTVNTFAVAEALSFQPRRLAKKVAPEKYERWATAQVTRRVSQVIRQHQPFDVLFVFKGVYVAPEVVSNFPGISVHYHPDDSANPENTSMAYALAEAHYDLHVTTKVHNIPELRERVPSQILFVECAYDPEWHFPPKGRVELRHAGLIGTNRPDRSKFVADVAREVAALGGAMTVAGTGWKSDRELRNIATVVGPRYGINFAKSVHESPLQLGVLNSANRDTHTCRTFEIPASGGLFIGERTVEHDRIFENNNNALLYGNDDEGIDMVRFALTHEAASDRLRLSGLDAISRGENTYADRARQIMKAIDA